MLIEYQNNVENEGIVVNYTEYKSVSCAVIDSLGTIKGTEVMERKPLFNWVDLEAVDRLFEKNTNDDLIVEQMIDGHAVTIQGTGELIIKK
ncbi:HalOD1 output domain-containing protein [Saliphagus sp. GCM10025308]